SEDRESVENFRDPDILFVPILIQSNIFSLVYFMHKPKTLPDYKTTCRKCRLRKFREVLARARQKSPELESVSDCMLLIIRSPHRFHSSTIPVVMTVSRAVVRISCSAKSRMDT
ncbi:hypothetical protein PMAYCL1PPCAC_16534, partial [Pristionchus mayeri]